MYYRPTVRQKVRPRYKATECRLSRRAQKRNWFQAIGIMQRKATLARNQRLDSRYQKRQNANTEFPVGGLISSKSNFTFHEISCLKIVSSVRALSNCYFHII
jgi:hypothetical protein